MRQNLNTPLKKIKSASTPSDQEKKSLERKLRQECLLRFMGRLNKKLERSELNPSLAWKFNYITLESSVVSFAAWQNPRRKEERALNDLHQ